MQKILSIDFDYFIDTTVEVRNNVFPDGVDEKNEVKMIADWVACYDEDPELLKIGVIQDDFIEVCKHLVTLKCPVVVRNSHKDIEILFREKGEYFIDHIDFHHDFYLGARPDVTDCSNWLRRVIEENPNSKVRWFRREDSETSSILGGYPYESYTKLQLEDTYDYVFICFSPEWTPIHLQSLYDLMVRCARYNNQNECTCVLIDQVLFSVYNQFITFKEVIIVIDNKVEQIKDHVEAIMDILEIPRTESNKNTPLRLAKMWCNELFKNRNNYNIEDLKARMALFPNEYSSDMVIVKDVDFNSVCEHHWLPFSGKVTVGYVPSYNVIGLSKIPRVVKFFSQKPQLQEQLTTEIGEFLYDLLEPHALFVEVEATHQCVKCRGAESNCSTKTYYKRTNKGFEDSYEEFKARM